MLNSPPSLLERCRTYIHTYIHTYRHTYSRQTTTAPSSPPSHAFWTTITVCIFYPPHTLHRQCTLARQVAWSSTGVTLARRRVNTDVSPTTLDCHSGHVILWLMFVFSEAGGTQEGVWEAETRALKTCWQIARQVLWNHFQCTHAHVHILTRRKNYIFHHHHLITVLVAQATCTYSSNRHHHVLYDIISPVPRSHPAFRRLQYRKTRTGRAWLWHHIICATNRRAQY